MNFLPLVLLMGGLLLVTHVYVDQYNFSNIIDNIIVGTYYKRNDSARLYMSLGIVMDTYNSQQ